VAFEYQTAFVAEKFAQSDESEHDARVVVVKPDALAITPRTPHYVGQLN